MRNRSRIAGALIATAGLGLGVRVGVELAHAPPWARRAASAESGGGTSTGRWQTNARGVAADVGRAQRGERRVAHEWSGAAVAANFGGAAPPALQGAEPGPESNAVLESHGDGVSGLILQAAVRTRGEILARVEGLDRRAPRPLVLWRVDPASGRSAPVARGASGADGRFRFDRLLLPAAGARLVAAPAGAVPSSALASQGIELAPAAPGPPVVQVEPAAGGRWRLIAHTAPTAVLVVNRGADVPPLRVPPRRSAALRRARPTHLSEIPAPAIGFVLVSQELPNGRRADWSAAAPAHFSAESPALAEPDNRRPPAMESPR